MVVDALPKAPVIVGKRYQFLDRVGAGGMGTVYRALDRLTGQTVALKQVTTAVEQLQFASRGDSVDFRLALVHEFKTLASLRHPHIVSVLDYGFDEQRQPYFTMEYFADAQTLLDAGQGQSVTTKINLLVQVLQALAYLHRRDILHRDLKPANVLVVDGQVKVLDFGLSASGGEQGETAGTLAYMAPEVLRGEASSEASDLYAVGMMAYELLAERHPFTLTDVNLLVNDILYTVPDVKVLDVDERVAAMIERLLAKQPADRYADASQIIAAYNAATHQQLPFETTATRESFLQAAQFVGRDAEFKQLSAALIDASNGTGSAWLVGGESGIGKSRLLDELRTLALVQGALVLRGQAVSDGGKPYQVWREVLRHLSLQVALSEQEASVLKGLIGDIGALLGREVAEAVEVSPQAAQERLVSVVEGVLGRVGQVGVVILEDLHWEGSESVALLKRVSRGVGQMPLLLVASFRDDERPDLPHDLPDMQLLKLERFTEDSIAALSESMLGSRGRQEEIIDLLQRETEGNAFFMVEVVRALAEEAGELDRIGTVTLPKRVFAGGIQKVIERRLNRVPDSYHPLLRAAAVAGRQLDVSVLRAIEPMMDLEQWLSTCGSAAVLDVEDGYWRFAHDKLREGLLADLAENLSEKQRLHRQVAEAVERVYPDAAEHAPALAHHWAQVGDAAKEAHYAAIAGAQALQKSAYQEAINFIQRAIVLHQQLEATTPLQLARWHRQLGEAYLGLGNLAESRRRLEDAVALLDEPQPKSSGKLVRTLLAQVIRQLLHRTRSSRYLGQASRRPEEREKLLEAVRSYGLLGRLQYEANERGPVFSSGIHALNLSERAGVSPELAQAYANMSIMASVARLNTLAENYARWAQETADKVDHPYTMAFVLFRHGVYSMNLGHWVKAREDFEQAMELFDTLGDRRQWEECLGFLGEVASYQGELERSLTHYEGLYKSAEERTGSVHSMAWGLVGQGSAVVRLGNLDRAIDLLKNGLDLIADHKDAISVQTFNHGTLAVAHLLSGQYDLARKVAEDTKQFQISSTSTTTYHGYAAVARVYLTLWEKSGDQPATQRDELAKLAVKACKALGGYTRSHPIGQPRRWLYQGWYDWLAGKQDKALKAWEQSLATAQQLAMPYEEALARYEVGRLLGQQYPNATEHLKRSREIFAQLHAAYDLGCVERVLGRDSTT